MQHVPALVLDDRPALIDVDEGRLRVDRLGLDPFEPDEGVHRDEHGLARLLWLRLRRRGGLALPEDARVIVG
jgi:hypothetical protein